MVLFQRTARQHAVDEVIASGNARGKRWRERCAGLTDRELERRGEIITRTEMQARIYRRFKKRDP